MTRQAMPYEAFGPDQNAGESPVVGTAPTLASRSVHGADFWIGLSVNGVLGTQPQAIAPVNAGPRSVSTPYVQPSTVAPDYIKPALFVSFNTYSPVSHPEARARFSEQIPVPAALPSTKMPGVNNRSRRSSGAAYTVPYPMAAPDWPTSTQWISDAMSQNQI